MNGQLGILAQNGRQVGGFLAWVVQHDLAAVLSPGLWSDYRPGFWSARAKRPWLLERCLSDAFDVTFYGFMSGKLVEYCREKVRVVLPSSYPLDEFIDFTLVMRRYG